MDQVVLFHDVQSLFDHIAADGKGGLATITTELHDLSPLSILSEYIKTASLF
jgi:hypothetical protein